MTEPFITDRWADELASLVEAGELSMDEAAGAVNAMLSMQGRMGRFVQYFVALNPNDFPPEGPDSYTFLLNRLFAAIVRCSGELLSIATEEGTMTDAGGAQREERLTALLYELGATFGATEVDLNNIFGLNGRRPWAGDEESAT